MSKQEEADRTIFVGNLDSNTREEILFELFLQAGPLTKVHIAKDKDGRQKTYGFVCFKHTESVPYAITLLNGIRLYGRPLNLQFRSGSSHTVEPSTAHLGVENTPCRAPQESFRNSPFQDRPGSSLYPTPPYSMNNHFNPDPYYWQTMMNTYALQQYHINSQMAQQQQYYQAMAHVGLPAQMPHFDPMPEYMSRSHQPAWENRLQRDPVLGNCSSSGGGGQARESDSDSDNKNMEKLQTASKQRSRQYKKHKSKKKKY
ncbi:splicing regulator RBM11-like [Chiloscyllium plagiosum]|uniref:splicing regulator RBM11-like n=1 Tax=Chiloscyllium plagiosum TaxID=36176 RepID=UPI001CB85008|nr:splicing regulator RBM11-like [Chiloscyllium plagiosum]